MSRPEKVCIIDDDQAIRDALVLLFETAGYAVAAFPAPDAFLDVCTADCEGCVILDVDMPGMSGLALQQVLRQRSINLPVVFLTGYGTIPMAVNAMRDGAIDFLTKPVDSKVLLKRVADALSRSREASAQSSEVRVLASRLAQLTEREHQIAKLIARGDSSKQIGQLLNISHRTVEVHRSHLMKKLGTASALEVAQLLFKLEGVRRERER
jgi:FixJ family two-component response regulator